MPDNCLVCERIAMIKANTNPYFVAELETGYVVIGDYQYFKGYSLFLCKQHVTELHELDIDFKLKFLREMAEVAQAVHLAFNPYKLNYELLGNTDRHAHWHIFPRYENEPDPKVATWEIDKSVRYSEAAKPSPEERENIKKRLLEALKQTAGNIA
jgi:diadenosine tetraphosphate (Ap4A) HIT family hydrolase